MLVLEPKPPPKGAVVEGAGVAVDDPKAEEPNKPPEVAGLAENGLVPVVDAPKLPNPEVVGCCA